MAGLLMSTIRNIFARPASDKFRKAPPGRRHVLTLRHDKAPVKVHDFLRYEYVEPWESGFLAGMGEGVLNEHILAMGNSQLDLIVIDNCLDRFHISQTYALLSAFSKTLRPSGWLELRAFDMQAVIRDMVNREADFGDTAYTSGVGNITYHDIIYGWSGGVERNALNDHRSGYTEAFARKILLACGFSHVYRLDSENDIEMQLAAFTDIPSVEARTMLRLRVPSGTDTKP